MWGARKENSAAATRGQIEQEFSGRSFKWGKCNGEEEKYCRIESEDSSLSLIDIYGDEADYEYGI